MRNIETERLLLTPWTMAEEDVEGLYEYASDPEVGPNAGWKPHADKAESAQIIKELFMPHEVWAIREKRTGKIMGSIGLEPDRRREDVASREMGYSLDYAFTQEKEPIVILAICTGPDNQRSQRVIEKCGFVYEGRQRKGYHIYDGSDRDNLVYSMLREEWEQRKNRG